MPKKKEKKCRNCKNVKVLDDTVGRCMVTEVPPLFCKLDDCTHVCDDYKGVK